MPDDTDYVADETRHLLDEADDNEVGTHVYHREYVPIWLNSPIHFTSSLHLNHKLYYHELALIY